MAFLNGSRMFPCPVCTSPLEVKTTKKDKPYIICDPCGVQLFVRGPSGIDAFSRLIERANKDDLWSRLVEMERRYLSFAKMRAGRRINDLQPCFGAQFAITLAHGQPVLALVRSTRSPFSRPWETCIGESRAAATAHRSEASTSKATARFVRQTVLGYCQAVLVHLERSSDRGHPRDSGSVASGRLSLLLAFDL